MNAYFHIDPFLTAKDTTTIESKILKLQLGYFHTNLYDNYLHVHPVDLDIDFLGVTALRSFEYDSRRALRVELHFMLLYLK